MAPRRYPARRRLGRAFFARPTETVARELLGCHLVHRGPELLALRLVEVEAYLGEGEDEASHAHRGPTPRNSQMFATPGHLYVYVSYGIHHCLNVVCEDHGRAGAVLLRAAEPLAGEAWMRRRRGRTGPDLSNGPGKLGQCLGADLGWNGWDLVEGALGLWPGEAPREIGVSTRIGISRDVERPLRFFDRDSPWVSRGGRARPFDEGEGA